MLHASLLHQPGLVSRGPCKTVTCWIERTRQVCVTYTNIGSPFIRQSFCDLSTRGIFRSFFSGSDTKLSRPQDWYLNSIIMTELHSRADPIERKEVSHKHKLYTCQRYCVTWTNRFYSSFYAVTRLPLWVLYHVTCILLHYHLGDIH